MAKLEIPPAEFATELVRGNLKAAMASAGATNPHALWKVPLDKIRVIPGFNTRIHTPEYEAHIEWLTNSILENGYDEDKPLAGYVVKEDDGDVIYLTDGHSRNLAVARANERGAQIETLPIVVKPKGTSMEDLTVALVTSNSGRPLTPYETAIVVKRLVGYGLDEPTIAKRLGFTQKYVNDLLTLVAAPKAVRDMIVAGKIAPTLAINMLTKHGAKAVEKLKAAVEKAEASGKKKATAKHVEKDKTAKPKSAKAAKPESPKSIDAADVLADAEKCGFATGSADLDDKLLSLAATLYARVGVDVYKTAPPEADPADGL
jgi:ParB-like chromosome segregation protein Spo0J